MDELPLACRDVAGVRRLGKAHHGQLLVFEYFIETHHVHSCIKRGRILSLSREWLGSEVSRCGSHSTDCGLPCINSLRPHL
ncbi:MAG: hypothetical protein CMH85_04395 [Novosphingobium sp.]|nr:hypothetical protein [Novosphingobium sp.]